MRVRGGVGRRPALHPWVRGEMPRSLAAKPNAPVVEEKTVFRRVPPLGMELEGCHGKVAATMCHYIYAYSPMSPLRKQDLASTP